jgi:hypothetical protein
MAGKKTAAPGTAFDITALFEQELQARNEDLRRQAAMTMFSKLHPTNKVSVEEFVSGLKQHKDVWAAVSTMGVLDFAEALVGRRPTESKPAKAQRRTRLSEAQKNSLKGHHRQRPVERPRWHEPLRDRREHQQRAAQQCRCRPNRAGQQAPSTAGRARR